MIIIKKIGRTMNCDLKECQNRWPHKHFEFSSTYPADAITYNFCSKQCIDIWSKTGSWHQTSIEQLHKDEFTLLKARHKEEITEFFRKYNKNER